MSKARTINVNFEGHNFWIHRFNAGSYYDLGLGEHTLGVLIKTEGGQDYDEYGDLIFDADDYYGEDVGHWHLHLDPIGYAPIINTSVTSKVCWDIDLGKVTTPTAKRRALKAIVSKTFLKSLTVKHYQHGNGDEVYYEYKN